MALVLCRNISIARCLVRSSRGLTRSCSVDCNSRPKMVLKIYKLDPSPPVRSVMMVADILNLSPQYIETNLLEKAHLTPEYLKMNPLHTIPVMEDGDLILNDSHAIIMYLADTYGKDQQLYPKDLKIRSKIHCMLFFNTGYLFPRLRAVTYSTIFEGLSEPSQQQIQNIEECYKFLEEFLTRSKWLVGNTMTLADIACVASVSTLVHLVPMDSKLYPKTQAWLTELSKTSFYQKCNAKGVEMLNQMIKEKWSK